MHHASAARVDTNRDDGAAEREVVRCYGSSDFVSNVFDRKTARRIGRLIESIPK
jgi:hypothetical protein